MKFVTSITAASALIPLTLISCSTSNSDKRVEQQTINQYLASNLKATIKGQETPIANILGEYLENNMTGSSNVNYASDERINYANAIYDETNNIDSQWKTSTNENVGFVNVSFASPIYVGNDTNWIKSYIQKTTKQIEKIISSPMVIGYYFEQNFSPSNIHVSQLQYCAYSFINGASEVWNKRFKKRGLDVNNERAEDRKVFFSNRLSYLREQHKQEFNNLFKTSRF